LSLGDVDGSKSYFRILTIDQVPGLSAITPTVPRYYYAHAVPWQDLGRKKGQWPIPVYCLCSPNAPNPKGDWPKDPAGAQECASIVLPSGRGLHSYGEPDPFAVFAVYQYTDSNTPVEELRNWSFKATQHPKGMMERFRALFRESAENGGNANNMVWSLERQGQFLSLGCQVALPNSNYAERFPWGPQQQANVARCAPDCLAWFLPKHTKESILEDLRIENKAGVTYDGGTGGPGAQSTVQMEV
jgi:hypothetical protein